MDTIDRRSFLKGFTAFAGCFAVTAGSTFTPAFAADEQLPVNARRFPQGLASGDPQPDAIMLWTRAVPDMPAGDIDLICQVSTDEHFQTVIVEKALRATAESDFTVRFFVVGLAPDTRYFYRFIANGEVGPHVGRTRTAPMPDAEQSIRFGFVSCQKYEAGFYGAWARLIADDKAAAPEEQLDFILHLGDFIYEVIGDMPEGVTATRKIPPFPDGSEPWAPDGTRPWWKPGATWAVTVDDYRHLYKTYLTDINLQAARARFPFVCTWDDHEFTNNAWQSHDTYFRPGKPAQSRKLASNQAWFEFIPAILTNAASVADVPTQAHDFTPRPVATSDYGQYDENYLNSNRDNLQALASLTIYRSLSWGRMLDLIVTDLRSYRSPPLVTTEVQGLLGGSGRPTPVRIIKELDAGKTANNGAPAATLNFENRSIANPRMDAPVGTCLGATQKQWFKETMKGSGARWRIWANTIPAVSMRLNLNKIPTMDLEDSYLGIDAWQGFPGELGELMGFLKDHEITNVISCSGDYHTHAAGRLAVDPDAENPEFVAVDFATTSITSGTVFDGAVRGVKKGHQLRPFITFESGGKLIENFNNTIMNGVLSGLTASYTGSGWLAGLVADERASPGLDFLDSKGNGYGLATITNEGADMTLVNIGTVTDEPGADGPSVLRRATFHVEDWSDGSPPTLGEVAFEGEPSFPFTRP